MVLPLRRWVLLLAAGGMLALAAAPAGAEDVYMTPEAFVRSAFGPEPPAPAVLWPSAALQQRIRGVLGHPYKQLRIRYWRVGDRTAWVLDEVGKEEEITLGFVLAADAIERTEVLVFRETRGWEIKFPAFTRQFGGAKLASGDALDKRIDGITGATLSVGAYQRLARLSLLLHQEVVSHAR